jgi:hypothetical protein
MTWPDTCANTADEYLAAIALGPNEEDFECRACGEIYDADGRSASTLCNMCVHEAVDVLAAELRRVRLAPEPVDYDVRLSPEPDDERDDAIGIAVRWEPSIGFVRR